MTSIVERDTEPGDSIYTFPNIPIFYLLTDRYPDTFGIVSWFDVEPDNFAVDDAQRIRESPPKVIIYLDVPEFVWEAHEEGFRGGEMSGQRMIKEAIVYLTSSGNYELEATYDVPDGYTLSVWRMLESRSCCRKPDLKIGAMVEKSDWYHFYLSFRYNSMRTRAFQIQVEPLGCRFRQTL